jgi:hypothetical protein
MNASVIPSIGATPFIINNFYYILISNCAFSMENTCLLIQIQRVFVAPDCLDLTPSWILDLNRFITREAKLSDYKMIELSSNPDPTHLIFSSKPLSSRKCSGNQASSVSSAGYNGFVEGHFTWRTGCGFVREIHTIGKISGQKKNPFHSNSVINKYLEFIEGFNSAYDDNLFLNVSFCLAYS